MVRQQESIIDMDDIIIETIPSYDMDMKSEVPTDIGQQEVISSKSFTNNRQPIKKEPEEDDSSYQGLIVTATDMAKNEDFSKFLIDGRTGRQKDKYRCLFCTKVFNYVSRLKLHLRVHTGEKPYACSICDFTASYKKSVEVHMRSHTGEKPYACSICKFRAARKANVDDHMRVHTGEKPFACPLCDFRSAQQSAVTCHLRRHTGEKKYQCIICNFRTAYKHILQAHHRMHTGERPFKCEECDYRGTTKLNVRLHMRRHTGEKPYACSMCDFRSTKRYSVKLHMRRHTGEKPYKCTECDYSAAQKFCLMKHLSTKHSENSYSTKNTCEFEINNIKRENSLNMSTVCPNCSIVCNNNIEMLDHLARAHSFFDQQTIQDIGHNISEYEELSVFASDIKEEPVLEEFPCLTCDFITSTKSNLKTHMLTHDLLHACKFCELKFPNPESMQEHLVLRHRSTKKRLYVCPFCTSLFEDRSQITKHLRESHTLLYYEDSDG